MSTIQEMIEKIELILSDNTISAKEVGHRLVEEIMRDEGYDSVIDQYPEIETIVEFGSDMEYEPEVITEEIRQEMDKLFTNIKQKLAKIEQ